MSGLMSLLVMAVELCNQGLRWIEGMRCQWSPAVASRGMRVLMWDPARELKASVSENEISEVECIDVGEGRERGNLKCVQVAAAKERGRCFCTQRR